LSAHNIFLKSAPKGRRCRWICGGLCDDEADGFCAGARVVLYSSFTWIPLSRGYLRYHRKN